MKFRQTVDEVPVYGSLISVELDETGALIGLDSALGEPDAVSPLAKVAPVAAVAAVKKRRPDVRGIDEVVPKLHFYFDATRKEWRLVYILEDVGVEEKASKSKRPAALERPHYMDFVVDAHTGSVVASLPRTPSVAVDQRAVDGMGNERRFRAERTGQRLTLEDKGLAVATFDFQFRDPTTQAERLPGTLISTPPARPAWKAEAVSAHANACAVVAYLQDVLLRNGIDNRGSTMASTVNCVVVAKSPDGREWRNAYWDPRLRQMVYGQVRTAAGGLRSLSVNVDVVAHEMFHGVTDSTSRLEYVTQSGALNESYSDIFGIIISNLPKPDPRQWDWLLGDGLLEDAVAFRDLSKPSRFGQPEHMDQFQVLPNTERGDWGGVHVNSGIHNKAAHNILTATSGRNLRFTPGEVAAVFYLALTQRLSRRSQFIDSRNAVVTSARTLFRNRPARERNGKIAAIEAAFSAVGIG